MSERWERAVHPRPSWWQRLVLWGTARGTFGKAPSALRIMAHARATFLSTALHEGVYSLSRVAPLRLKVLAGQRVSSLVGCTW
jgi:hypothetical protein